MYTSLYLKIMQVLTQRDANLAWRRQEWSKLLAMGLVEALGAVCADLGQLLHELLEKDLEGELAGQTCAKYIHRGSIYK